MFYSRPSHLIAALYALLVTFLWSTSWVLIKFGLKDIPALTFAGLRYGLAFLCLLPFALRPAGRYSLRDLSARQWAWLIVLGVLFYAVTQGAQFLGLAYLPAVTVSLLLNFTSVIVALLGIWLLAERLAVFQWVGLSLFIVGVVTYFYPIVLPAGQTVGFIVVIVGVLANALSSILGRHVNRMGGISPLVVTTVSMGVGASLLLIIGISMQGLPHLNLANWAMIGWLAVVNTALAFTLWNQTLRILSALESSIINGTMLVQIALLAWLLLGEQFTLQKAAGLALAGLGALIVQLRPR
jgi:drug/metabolite transporter (DMT)-like permease